MKRRKFLVGIGLCAGALLPLACGSKKSKEEEGGEAPKEPPIPGQEGAPTEGKEKTGG